MKKLIEEKPMFVLIVLVLVGVLFFGGKEVFKTHENEVKTLREEVSSRDVRIRELMEINANLRLQESHTIERLTTPAGTVKEKITKNVNKEIDINIKNDKKEEIKEDLKVVENKQEKNKTTELTNPKKLGINIGINNNLNYYFNVDYSFFPPFSIGIHTNPKEKEVGLQIGFRF